MATTTVETQVEKPKTSIQQSPTSPRKKRRRAPATGAADDCFSCQERQTKCDRRRPYCTQCLDQGKDCSGYKTTLTWGVGVASRGKLRGLALPIAKSRKAEQDTDSKPENNSRKRSFDEASKPSPTREPLQSPSSKGFSYTGGSTSAASTATTYDFVNMDHSSTDPSSSMYPPPNLQWRTPRPGGQMPSRPSKRMRSHSLEPLHVAASQPVRDLGMPMTADVVAGFRDHEFGLSMQCSPVTPTFPNYTPYTSNYAGYPLHASQQPMIPNSCESNFFAAPELSWSSGSISSSFSSSSNHSKQEYHDDHGFLADPVIVDTLDSILSAQQNMSQQDYGNAGVQSDSKAPEVPHYLKQLQQSPQLVPDDVGAHTTLSLSRSFPALSIGNTPGLQFLIDYYDRVISPVIVAFDGPTNPYRTHILRLATGSETLQHAIAALSASNLRMRRGSNPQSGKGSKRRSLTDCSYDKSVRKSLIAHSLMDVGLESLPQTSTSDPSGEELFHKTASIRLLNEQLADPKRRKDDSILATLLILCLYHICDTGVAKFKTQFAGVKKILALRGGTRGPNSKATNWLTIMFTWFDAMTATVNDREGQMPDFDIGSSDEWALENLAGCDGRLFKTIAKLGRLNMLSQSKPVRGSSPMTSRSKGRSVSPSSKSQDYYSMRPNRYDGNGWSLLAEREPENIDSRTQFWREWNEIRQALQDWELDASDSTSPSSQGDRLDLYNISESFRYSALLYTERLAYPHLPSTNPKFQKLVTQALHHITNVKTDVFLLWPLFITGTECVSAEGRHLIRERCLDIQKDSGFFNNISGLELLERIWRDDTNDMIDDHAHMNGMKFNERTCARQGGKGFKWRKAMERVDGEYIVV